jgi:hypothetical protein
MIFVLLALCTFFLIQGCSPSENNRDTESHVTHDNSKVAAIVNGESIFHADVDFFIEKTFNHSKDLFSSEELRGNVLKSLISAKAMKQEISKTLSTEEKNKLYLTVKAFEDELFVKSYLKKHAVPEPVTSKMVSSYYDSNLDAFGQSKRKVFETIKSSKKATEKERDEFLAKTEKIKKTPDWKTFSSTSLLSIEYQKATYTTGLYEKNIEIILSKLNVNEVSDVTMINGVPMIFKVIEVQVLPPKALHEVNVDIRRRLAPMQLKKSIKRASDEVVSKSSVKIL